MVIPGGIVRLTVDCGLTTKKKKEAKKDNGIYISSENQSQVQNHSAEKIYAEESDEEFRQLINAKRQKINFPPACAKEQWEALDSKLILQLDKLIGKSTLEYKLTTSVTLSTFGAKQHQAKREPKKSRRQREMETLRKQKKNLRKQMKSATEEEKNGLQELWRGSLSLQKEQLEAHLRKTYSDPNREIPLSEPAGLVWPAAPGEEFNSKPPSLKEINAVVQKARAKSAPGPSGVPYLLYKRCPNVLKRLHKILRGAWTNLKISEQWMSADGVYIPKEQNSTEINQFRPISLLNVEGKIFFSVMASRLTKYLTENGYINTSVQKGGIPGVSGCLEHATMIWEAIQRAKSEKLNLDVIWLDLANAYGSVPHQMIQLALRMYHVPEDIQVMLDDYFSGFRMRFSTNSYTTDGINLEIGITMGCTISPILFVMAMEVILKAAEDSAGPANLGGGCYMPPLKAFMDDTTIICSKEDETRRMLEHLDVLMAWCRVKFKPKKSRSLSVRKGKIDATTIYTDTNGQSRTS
ncbi:hypothetical protein RRG08_047516 [Elysia crispata]|uniref:Reverse transcriptase domain-containing protein n=1 Tax=Elysia crispata TaxID=231223 RepID=A0AAE0XY07_9GAST|nr:hypothetical protein RRG08_047516 [Elysia crispata]